MKFCQHHWDKMRYAIKSRGIWDLVAADGHEAIAQLKQEIEGKPKTLQKFDPLMAVHWMIVNRAMGMLQVIGENPLSLMMENKEHPEHECPICYLNFLSAEHDRTCTEPDCKKPRGLTFDDWIEGASDEAVRLSKELPRETA